jgi:hypothetical protein
MSNKTIVLFVSLFALIVAGMFLFTYLHKQNTQADTPLPEQQSTSTPNMYGITRIDGKHFFIDGVHTIVGELTLPTPCDLLTTDARVAESYPEQVTFAFSVVNTTETCAQVMTNQRFKVEASASKEANLAATFAGTPVELNLVEAAPGETPDTFELFIKG